MGLVHVPATHIEYEQVQEVKEIQIEVTYSEERIKDMIKDTFPENPTLALEVFACESGLNQDAVGPTQDYGIAQIHEPSWNATAKELGLDYKNDAKDNLAMARHVYEQQGWDAWVCLDLI